MTAGRGFIAIALVIFASWNPLWAIAGALLFGGAEGCSCSFRRAGADVSPFLMTMVPYLLTLAGADVLGMEPPVAAPAALGRNFCRRRVARSESVATAPGRRNERRQR